MSADLTKSSKFLSRKKQFGLVSILLQSLQTTVEGRLLELVAKAEAYHWDT